LHKEYERRKVQPLVVMAQHPFQLKRPRKVDKEWGWLQELPAGVVFDPLSVVSATYGVAFQTQFREEQGPWSSRPAIFVIDPSGVLRYADSWLDEDPREEHFFPVLDDVEEQRRLITALRGQEKLREAVRIALAPLGPRSKSASPALTEALKDESAEVRAGAAAALYWLAPSSQAAIPALGKALGDSDHRVRRLSCQALGRIGPTARTVAPALLDRLKDTNDRVRAEAARAWPAIAADPGPATPALVELMKDRSAPVRAAAATALGAIGTKAPAVVAVLRKALKDRDESVRAAAAEALKKIGPEAAGKGGR
jgi:HEAT repeat protein